MKSIAEEVTLRVDPAGDPAEVKIAGEFNGWTPEAAKDAGGGVFEITADLAPGTYGYKLVLGEDKWVLDPSNPAQKIVGKEANSAWIVEGPKRERPVLPAREWQDRQGRAMTAELVSATETEARFLRDGAEMTVALELLQPQDAGFARGWSTAMDQAFPPEVPVPLIDGVPLRAGLKFIFPAPVDEKTAKVAAEGLDGNSPGGNSLTSVEVALAAPKGLDAGAARQPIAIIVHGSDDAGLSSKHMDSYASTLAAAGWLVMAADPVPVPVEDHHGVRWAVNKAALDWLAAKWPASADWPVAVFAYSGGVWHGSAVTMMLAREEKNRDVLGVWLGGVTEDGLSPNLQSIAPLRGRVRNLKVMVSASGGDTTASPAMVKDVAEAMKSAFPDLRFELSAQGGHEPSAEHLKMAAEWFVSEGS